MKHSYHRRLASVSLSGAYDLPSAKREILRLGANAALTRTYRGLTPRSDVNYAAQSNCVRQLKFNSRTPFTFTVAE